MRTRPLLALLAAGTVVLAACGSDNSYSSSSGTTAAAAAAPATTAAATSPTTATSGYGGGYAVPPTTAPAAPAAPSGSAAVTLADSPLGKIAVDAKGLTLYAFLKDASGTPTCLDACAKAWPPATVTGAATAGAGITASLLTTVARPDGSMQLKLGAWPLYHFAGDGAPGATTGQGTGGVWYVVGANGTPIKG